MIHLASERSSANRVVLRLFGSQVWHVRLEASAYLPSKLVFPRGAEGEEEARPLDSTSASQQPASSLCEGPDLRDGPITELQHERAYGNQ